MSRPARALGALAALFFLGLLVLSLVLPRIAASDAVRTRLTDAVRDATRRELSFDSLGAGLFPPRLELDAPRLSGDAAGPAASAERIELRLALLPLLVRAVVVRSLVVERGTLRLERSERGVRLAGEDLPEPPKREAPAEAKPERSGGERFAFGVQRVLLRGSSLQLDDRTREPAPHLALQNLEGEARASAPDAPVDVELRGDLESGGTLSLRGGGRASGPFEAILELADVELTPFSAYAGEAQLAARASGTLRASGSGTRPDHAVLDLAVEAVGIAAGEFTASGPLALHAELSGELREPVGPFRLDASGGELTYRRAFRKPAGVQALAEGTLRRERGEGGASLRAEGVTLDLGEVRATGELELAPRLRVALDAPPFEASALEALVPALAGRRLSGKLALVGLRVEAAPLSVHGDLTLDALGIAGPGSEPLVLRGALQGTGEAIEGRQLRVSLAGEEAPLTLRLDDLAGERRLRVAGHLERADSSALVAALGGDRELLSGPLDLDADLTAPLGGAQPPLAAARGEVSLRIAPGRLRNVSLLRSAFQAAGAAQAARGKDAEALRKHYGDEFESLAGHFHVAGGAARTDDLRLVYGGYTAELRGSVGLADRALDLHGELQVADNGPGRVRSIPLAAVQGTLDEPRVTLTREALAGVASAYAGDERRREKWEKKLDERLGEGRGKDVLQALDKVLKSLQEPPPEGAEPPE